MQPPKFSLVYVTNAHMRLVLQLASQLVLHAGIACFNTVIMYCTETWWRSIPMLLALGHHLSSEMALGNLL